MIKFLYIFFSFIIFNPQSKGQIKIPLNELAEPKNINLKGQWHTLESYLVTLFLGIFLMMAVYYLLQYLKRKKERTILYFMGLLLSVFFLFFLTDGHISIFLDRWKPLWFILKKLKYSFLIICFLSNSFFMKEMFPESPFFKVLARGGGYLGTLIIMIFLLLPSTFFTKSFILTSVYTYLLLTSLCYIIELAFRFKDKRYARSLLIVTILPTTAMAMGAFQIKGIPHLSLILMGLWPIGQSMILLIKDFDAHNALEKLSIDLQKEVDDKTKDLKGEKDNISKLLDNMEEVIFVIDNQGIIISDYSKSMFGQEIIGKSVYETLFASIPKNDSLFSEIQSIASSRGKDLKEWNDQKEKLPHQVKIKNNHKETDVSIRYGETLSDDKTKVKDIVLSLADITENEILKEQRFNEKKRNIIISELAPEKGRDLEKYKNNLSHFFTSARSLISEASRIASGTSVDKINKWDEQLIWTNVHKVKGRSSLFGLKGLSLRLHEEESKFMVFKRGEKKLSDDIILEICESLLAIIEIISEYESTAEFLFGINPLTKKSKETRYIEIKKLDVVDKKIKLLSEKVNIPEMDNVNREWQNLFKSSMIDLFNNFESLVEGTSKELGKTISYRVGGDDIHLTDQFMSKILDSASHLLRNSIDHGIELPMVRVKKGKPKKGTIEVTCLMLESVFQVKIKDDGGGIDEELIGKKAIKKNLISKEDYNRLLDHEKIYLIFLKGLSSKDEATMISGRGIGMDIVKVNIENLGGKVKVETEKGKGTEFTILLPLGSKGELN